MSIGIVIGDVTTYQQVDQYYGIVADEAKKPAWEPARQGLRALGIRIDKEADRAQVLAGAKELMDKYHVNMIAAFNAKFDKDHLPEFQEDYTWIDIMLPCAYRQYNPYLPAYINTYKTGKVFSGYKVVSKTLNYSQFRKKIVPHMKEVVYYPDCIDIFDIRIYGGISYFLLDKNTCEDKVIKNVNASHQEFNSVESRKLDASGILNNLGTEINELLSSYKKVKTFNTNGRYQVWITDTYDSFSNGSCMFRSDGKTGVLCPTRIIDSKNSKNTVGTAKLLFASDIKAECESFVSWLWCKFIRFMILIAVDGFHIGANMHYYRFVPAPPIQQTDLTANPWDHIYTDKELYDYFKLPQKYIDVIESVIKERKKLEQ